MRYVLALAFLILSGCATATSLPALPPTPALPQVQSLDKGCPQDLTCLDKTNLKALIQRDAILQADDMRVRKLYSEHAHAGTGN